MLRELLRLLRHLVLENVQINLRDYVVMPSLDPIFNILVPQKAVREGVAFLSQYGDCVCRCRIRTFCSQTK